MKRSILFLCLVCFVASQAIAYDFSVEGLCYTITSDQSPYTVAVSECNKTLISNDLIIPSSVTYEGVAYSVTSIGVNAFFACYNLTSVAIPNTITFIGSGAFCACQNLTAITIPESVKLIEQNAFASCRLLASVVVETGNTVYDSRNNCNAIIETATNTLLCGCRNTHIPTNVTSIGMGAFSGLLELTSITIPNSVRRIESYAFQDCSDLASVTIGSSVAYIGDYAFRKCSALASIICLPSLPPQLKIDVFSGVWSSVPVQVPCMSLEAYQTARNWNVFNNFQEQVPSCIIQSSDIALGHVYTEGKVESCGDVITVSATPVATGSLFVQWSDGNTDNPRTLTVTQDTVLTAEFQLVTSGKCGDDLYWQYTDDTIKITGTGTMYNYTESTQPWLLLRDKIEVVQTGNTVASIGESAFAQTVKLAKLYIGTGMENIAQNAFAGCQRLCGIYCNPVYPPFADDTSFANYNACLYVPCEDDVQRKYMLDVVWGRFRDIECLQPDDSSFVGEVIMASGPNGIRKIFRNGQILILRGKGVYTVLGEKIE